MNISYDVKDLHILYMFYRSIGIVGRVFDNGPVGRSSNPGRVLPERKMVIDVSLLNSQHYKVRIKGKWRNSGEGLASSLTSRSSSCWKDSLWASLDFSWPTCYISTSKNIQKYNQNMNTWNRHNVHKILINI